LTFRQLGRGAIQVIVVMAPSVPLMTAEMLIREIDEGAR